MGADEASRLRQGILAGLMSLHRLLRLADSDQIPADCRAWLRDGLDLFVDGGESLESCLDVRQVSEQIFEIRRNRHLRRAAAVLPKMSQWRKAVILAEEVSRFEAIIWPSWRLMPGPPEIASKLRRHLFLARRQKAIPTSPRQLHRILTE